MTINEFVQTGIHILPDGVTVCYHGCVVVLSEPMLMLIKKSDEGKVNAAYINLAGCKVIVPIKALNALTDNSTGEVLYLREEE